MQFSAKIINKHTHFGSWRPPGENPRSATENITLPQTWFAGGNYYGGQASRCLPSFASKAPMIDRMWNWSSVWFREWTFVSKNHFASSNLEICTDFHSQFLSSLKGWLHCVTCYVMLWPALTWTGQEWAQHVQGQLLHTCAMQKAGSHHVMELLSVSI